VVSFSEGKSQSISFVMSTEMREKEEKSTLSKKKKGIERNLYSQLTSREDVPKYSSRRRRGGERKKRDLLMPFHDKREKEKKKEENRNGPSAPNRSESLNAKPHNGKRQRTRSSFWRKKGKCERTYLRVKSKGVPGLCRQPPEGREKERTASIPSSFNRPGVGRRDKNKT